MSVWTLRQVQNLIRFPFPDPPIDLSSATKLKEVTFRHETLMDLQSIAEKLDTIRSGHKDLEKVTIRLSLENLYLYTGSKRMRLDQALVQFRESCPKVCVRFVSTMCFEPQFTQWKQRRGMI